MSALPVPGFPCPECGFALVATVQTLLGSEPLRCGQCGLPLYLVPERSVDALQALREHSEKQENARTTASQK